MCSATSNASSEHQKSLHDPFKAEKLTLISDKKNVLKSPVSLDELTNTTGWILGDLVDLRSASQ